MATKATKGVIDFTTFDTDDITEGSTNKYISSADQTKLDGIETGADVTDATNVDAAGAVMNSDTSTAGMSFGIDEDDMASDSATKFPTQQSVKAYAEMNIGRAPDIIVEDQKSSGTDGGTFTQAGWRTRDLNTEVRDARGECTLSSNQITLTAGTYYAEIWASAYSVWRHFARLYNTTGTVVVLSGGTMTASASNAVGNRALIKGVFTIAASQALELQHYCETTASTDGFGRGYSSPALTEVFSQVSLWRLS